MPETKRWRLPAVVVTLALACLLTLAFGGRPAEEKPPMTPSKTKAPIPPIDAAAPKITRTATFALG